MATAGIPPEAGSDEMPDNLIETLKDLPVDRAAREALNKIIATPEQVVRGIDGAVPKQAAGRVDLPSTDPDEENREEIMEQARKIVEEDRKSTEGTLHGIVYKVAKKHFISEDPNLKIKVPGYFIQCPTYLALDPSSRSGYSSYNRCIVGGMFVQFKDHKYVTDNMYEIEYLESDACRQKNRIIAVEV